MMPWSTVRISTSHTVVPWFFSSAALITFPGKLSKAVRTWQGNRGGYATP